MAEELPRVKADFLVHGREVWAVPDRYWGGHRGADAPYMVSPGNRCNGHCLSADGSTWQHHAEFDSIPGYATAEEALAFAAQFRDDRPQGIKLPFQIAGEDVWVCGDRLQHPPVLDTSLPYYVANGPEGRATKFLGGYDYAWRTLDYSTTGGAWVTYASAQEAADLAYRAAGVPSVDIKTLAAPAVKAVPPQLETLLGKTLMALLRLPTPPANIQGLILQKTGLPVPAEACQSESVLTEWMQANYTPPKGKVAAPVRSSNNRYSVDVSYDEREYGRARWSRTVSYSGTETFTEDELADIVRDCSDRDEMMEAIERAIMDDRNGDYDEVSDTGYDYDDHEITDSEGAENVEVSGIRQVLDQFLANNPEFDPDYEEEEDEDEEEGALEAERPFEVGQRVVGHGVQSEHDITGMIGTVVATGILSVLVDFDEERDWLHEGHSAPGVHRDHHCWWCNPEHLRPLEPVTA